MDKERQNKTLTLSELLNKTVLKDKFNKTAYSNVAKYSTIFSFWDNIVGKKLSNLSKPYKIKDSKIYVTTKSPTVSQQITLTKNKILEKINVYSKPLGIKIDDIVVNYKNYDEITSPTEIPEDEKLIWFDEKELEKIEIPEEVIKSTKAAIDKINFIDKTKKEELVKKILNNYKAEILRKNIQNE